MNTYYGKDLLDWLRRRCWLVLPVAVCMPEAGDPLTAQFTNWVPQQYQIWCGRPGGLLKSGWSSVVLGDWRSWVQKLARHGGSGIELNKQGAKSSSHNSPRPSFLVLSLCRCRTLWGEAPLLGYSFLETSLQTHPEACQLIPDPIRLAINTKCKRKCVTCHGKARYWERAKERLCHWLSSGNRDFLGWWHKFWTPLVIYMVISSSLNSFNGGTNQRGFPFSHLVADGWKEWWAIVLYPKGCQMGRAQGRPAVSAHTQIASGWWPGFSVNESLPRQMGCGKQTLTIVFFF